MPSAARICLLVAATLVTACVPTRLSSETVVERGVRGPAAVEQATGQRMVAQTASGTPVVASVTPLGKAFRLGVEREGATHWLPPSTDGTGACKAGIGPPPVVPAYDCDFRSWTVALVDVDGDGEPDVLSEWTQSGSGVVRNFYLDAWDGTAYILALRLVGKALHMEHVDLDGDGRMDLVARYNVAPLNPCRIPWVEVYSYSGGRTTPASSLHPRLYTELLAEYSRLRPATVDWLPYRPECVREFQAREDELRQMLGVAAPG